LKVLVVGQNPSRHNLDPKVAFEGTKSFNVIEDWMQEMSVSDNSYMLVNAFIKVNQKYNKDEFDIAVARLHSYMKIIKPEKVIALGKMAAKALKKAGIDHFELPHPSGRNRKLNDMEWLQEQLLQAREYIWSDDYSVFV
jgi:uracil-DNA glycosylase